jgi:hypothetical protein
VDSAGYWLVLTNGLGAPVDTDQYVWGANIPYGAKVVAITGAGLNDSVRIDKLILDNGTQTVSFGVRDNTTYGAGDVLGQSQLAGNFNIVYNAWIVDSTDAIASATPFDLHFFDEEPSYQVDSAVTNHTDPDGVKMCGELIFPSSSDYGGYRVAIPQRNTTQYAIPLVLTKRPGYNKVYVRLLARGTWAVPSNMNALTLKMVVGK